MSAMAAFSDDADGTPGTLRFTGSLSLATLGDLPERLLRYEGEVRRIDLSGIERIDTIGAWTIHRFAQMRGAEVEGLSADGQHLFDQVAASDQPVRIRSDRLSPFSRVLGEVGLSRGCRCNAEHIRSVLSRFSAEERAAMADADGMIAVDCEFCSRAFPVAIGDLAD